ncbi:SemiSWEET family transporter [Herbaspirillum sp. YR522]|uniref:SemiSWEET family transporter n=1 Tax=Herbaspirillum sp. YR522 TaxID=1144342 RepID=UPI00026F76BF|nr:SemiSWEET family transporter [Herbaspirillum sp. YR522]EJN03220.1 hypothetical protein PMI40_02769 [Herbaspirillum sp. YR522]
MRIPEALTMDLSYSNLRTRLTAMATVEAHDDAMKPELTDLIGWGATIVLLLTISSQVYQQWRSRSTQGVSHWLFAGQLVASAGFVTYSMLQGDVVFVVSNIFLLLTALLGQVLYLRNRRRNDQ